MIIKKYIVDNMKQAVTRAKYEFGSQAMILSQRYIRKGKWYNPLKRKKLEVTVAVESDDKKKNVNIEKTSSNTKNQKPEGNLQVNEEGKFLEDSSSLMKGKLESYCQLKGLESLNLSPEDIKEFVGMGFKENPFERKLKPKKINILVGPTGVGKTTTIAKVAAKEHLENNKRIGILSIDTYKIGAVEQIEAYAKLLALPFEVVNKPEDMENSLNRLSNCDLILVDTLGTSQRNDSKLNEIKKYINEIQEANIYLVMSVSTDKKTMFSILNKYKRLDFKAIVLTKLDEVTSLENLWNIVENSSYPIEYFCFGQEVPNDIKIASLDNLISYSKEIYRHD